MAFIEAVVKATGKKQRIPAHWLDNPRLAEPFRLTAREAKKADPAPRRRSTKKADEPKGD